MYVAHQYCAVLLPGYIHSRDVMYSVGVSILAHGHGRLIDWRRSYLHLTNILFQIPNFDPLVVDEVYKKFGEPVKLANQRLDNGPLGLGVSAYSVFRADAVIPADQIQDNKIKISDFGEAFLSSGHKCDLFLSAIKVSLIA